MFDISYQHALNCADALKRIGQTTIHLSHCGMPWDRVTRCEPGCCFRNGIATSVDFYAEEAGLSFRWSMDLEAHGANGESLFKIDVDSCREVLKLLPVAVRGPFRSLLASTATAVREKGVEYQKAADNQFAMAASLSDLCAA